jgi:hypothetical protein
LIYRRNNSGSLAIFTAISRASTSASNFTADSAAYADR